LPILLQVPHFQALTHTSMILLHIPWDALGKCFILRYLQRIKYEPF
jgi:hypothetical protein